MSAEFGMIIALAAFGVVAAAPMIVIPLIIAPKKPTPVKLSPFECGQVPIGEGKFHFMMQYYSYLLMFVVFDVLAMFLYAWGVSSAGLGPQSSIIILMFLAIMFVPLGYAMHLAGRRELW